MTLVFMVLAIAACIGWTLHARTLRLALHKARGEIDALENHEQIAASRIEDLLAEFDTKPFTLADYQRERAELERRFLASHGTHAEDIDTAIRRGILLCNDPLVEEWVALQALAPYVSAENE
jgi:hypothetical protein